MGSISRGKVQGRIERFIDHFGVNQRLGWVFSICHDLGIDNPIKWMNETPPVVVDWWIAYRCFKSEAEAAAYEKIKNGGKRTFDANSPDLGDYLNKVSNGK